jgi:hypothetical protein
MTKNTDTGGPAFPRPAVFTQVHGLASVEQDGMTLRDYFAAKAMQNFRDQIGSQSDQEWFEQIAQGAYRMADAMLRERTQND